MLREKHEQEEKQVTEVEEKLKQWEHALTETIHKLEHKIKLIGETTSKSADDTLIGKFIEDWYYVASKLGKGGGGSCYKAIDKDIKTEDGKNAEICIKIIEDSDIAGALDTFKKEID